MTGYTNYYIYKTQDKTFNLDFYIGFCLVMYSFIPLL